MSPRTYIVEVSAEIVERFTDWTSVESLDVEAFKVIPHAGGIAEVQLRSKPPEPEDLVA